MRGTRSSTVSPPSGTAVSGEVDIWIGCASTPSPASASPTDPAVVQTSRVPRALVQGQPAGPVEDHVVAVGDLVGHGRLDAVLRRRADPGRGQRGGDVLAVGVHDAVHAVDGHGDGLVDGQCGDAAADECDDDGGDEYLQRAARASGLGRLRGAPCSAAAGRGGPAGGCRRGRDGRDDLRLVRHLVGRGLHHGGRRRERGGRRGGLDDSAIGPVDRLVVDDDRDLAGLRGRIDDGQRLGVTTARPVVRSSEPTVGRALVRSDGAKYCAPGCCGSTAGIRTFHGR